MKAIFMLVGCIALAGCASIAAKPTSYGIAMTSRLARGQYMALHLGGAPACFGDVSSGNAVHCQSVANVPRTVEVVWGAPSRWENPSGSDEGVPTGWKVPTSDVRRVRLSADWLYPPRWFRSGDTVVFTINQWDRLSVTYTCHRPGHECISYPPVTVFGEPQGVAALAALAPSP